MFLFEGNPIIIQIDGNEPMGKAAEKVLIKTGCSFSSTYFLYDGYKINLNEKISNIANSFDRENKRMTIII
jgi:hypothetical protein